MKRFLIASVLMLGVASQITGCASEVVVARPVGCAGGQWIPGHWGPYGHRWFPGHWRCIGVVEVVQ